jgi:tRNA-specific 2-thiouridylase
MKIAVAMSGGVDSSLAAALLKAGGHEVTGLTMDLSRGRGTAVAPARRNAEHIGIEHQVLDLADEFQEAVLRPAWLEYAGGRTPSPCLRCNVEMKFGLLADAAFRMGAERLATGHYARVEAGPDGAPILLRGADPSKDQSYFLAFLSRQQLERSTFPLGAMTKQVVRAMAAELGLPGAAAAESQDACIVQEGESFAETLRNLFGAEARPGPVVDDEGRMLGTHGGAHLFTIGQRKGMPAPASGRCWVKAIEPERRTVRVTCDRDKLMAVKLAASRVNWIGGTPPSGQIRCGVQIRYRHEAVPARLYPVGGDKVEVFFDSPVRAVTPGQAAVFYDGERVLGGGWID